MEGWYRWLISMLLIVYLCPSSTVVGMSFSYVIAASVPCSHGYTSDATTGVKQRPAAAAAAGGHRLERQPHAISRTISDQLQPAHGAVAAALEQSQQLKQTGEPLLTVSSLIFTNLTSHSIPITSADYSSPLYMRNKRFKLWGSTRTALSTLLQDNVSQT